MTVVRDRLDRHCQRVQANTKTDRPMVTKSRGCLHGCVHVAHVVYAESSPTLGACLLFAGFTQAAWIDRERFRGTAAEEGRKTRTTPRVQRRPSSSSGANGVRIVKRPTTRRRRLSSSSAKHLIKAMSQPWKSQPAGERVQWEGLTKKKEHEVMYPNYVYRPQRTKERAKLKKATGRNGGAQNADTESYISSVFPVASPPIVSPLGRHPASGRLHALMPHTTSPSPKIYPTLTMTI
ncbi:hypothetical protein FOMPIDRAFT_1050674 [Fomitopsis schrenkii]|uniref:HMG box domain-containing protein n=1 Tax=Fomitopsis schrenkii TaxID=2126942 RepID=S8E7N3_FOMSC|nr:hypothetical protein FOMPIDRAFT_1050640 [Fomitopsis schrenkii]EPS99397.1 hypothetical protein FOMPIDRAFT_1050674 [Fomitopsis schrenkii]